MIIKAQGEKHTGKLTKHQPFEHNSKAFTFFFFFFLKRLLPFIIIIINNIIMMYFYHCFAAELSFSNHRSTLYSKTSMDHCIK